MSCVSAVGSAVDSVLILSAVAAAAAAGCDDGDVKTAVAETPASTAQDSPGTRVLPPTISHLFPTVETAAE